ESDLLEALITIPETVAALALTLFETSGVVATRTRFQLYQSDSQLESALAGSSRDWEIYLHPSQQYIVELPIDQRVAISGSAGTGKTVCAWYRARHLANLGNSVGFVCPNQSALAVSKAMMAR